jgi:sigma-E factor negative regulatory protein RseB
MTVPVVWRPPQWLAPLMRLALLACLLPGPVLAASPGAAAAGQPPEDPRAWLQRIHQAANKGNYRGTLMVSAGGAISSSRVWHFCIGDQTYERLESQDGRQQTILRHNDDVHTLWPQARTAFLERRDAGPVVETTPQSVDPRALEQYRLRREGPSRVAGREAWVFLLEPRDNLRFAQRLWADQASGLMLRADVLAPAPLSPAAPAAAAAAGVLESSGFVEVEIGIKPQPRAVLDAMRALDGFKVHRPVQQRTRLEDEGFTLARPVPGFALVHCLRRSVAGIGEDGRLGEARVLQAVFSDGLARASVFIEPFDPARHKREGLSAGGATHTLSLRRQEHWITVVGDVPAAALRLLADAIERRR